MNEIRKKRKKKRKQHDELNWVLIYFPYFKYLLKTSAW